MKSGLLSLSTMPADEQYMMRCLELAQRGASTVAPNPMVGAVLVHEGRVIGEGWHQIYGKAHAEVNCFEQVAEADRHLIPDSTMYVSLEPCAHTGKTPPCANRIVQKGVQRVVIANHDPFKQVDGAGIGILQRAGIEVKTGILAQKGRWLNRRFFCFHERKRPYIILKWAQSAEGFMAPSDRSRTQLSNHYSQTLVHRWRTEESAIMVGYQTALHDNPMLTARLWPGHQPLRIVPDRKLQLPTDSHLYNQDASSWIINEQRDETQGNISFLKADFAQNILPQVLEQLYRHNKLSLIIEGGPALLRSFIEAGLWDEARIFKTPVTIGNGIAAPNLPLALPASETAIAGDALQLWLNKDSRYSYPAGMSL